MTEFLEMNVVDEHPNIPCTWNMGTECSTNVSKRKMFGDQLEIVVCDHHYEEHAKVMVLNHAYKMNIESVIELSPEERGEQLKRLTGYSDLNESMMRQALEKVGEDTPEDLSQLSRNFVKKFT